MVSEALQFAQQRKLKDNLLKKIVLYDPTSDFLVILNSLKLLQILTLSKIKQAYHVGYFLIVPY